MSKIKNIKKRDEIEKKYKWNIEKMYKDTDAWEKDYKEIENLSSDFVKLKGNIITSSKNLLNSIEKIEEINRKLEKLYVYGKMKLDEDTKNSIYQELNGKSMSLIAKVGSDTSFFTPELMDLTSEKIKDYMDENEKLKKYDFLFRELLKNKEHILSEKEESLISKLGEVTNGSKEAFSMLNNADMTFGQVTLDDGSKVDLTHGNYINFLESQDRNLRKEAYENLYKVYEGHINTLSSLYNNSVKGDVISSQIRNFSSSLDASLSPKEIPEEVYYNLIEVVHCYLPKLHKYMELRKKVLNVDELKMYDVYVPLVKIPEKNIPYEEGVELVYKALAPLGEEYVNQVKKGIEDGWIDIYENENKASGAYSFGSYDSDPYILMNYTDKLQDVLTLIHEMGHSMHSFYTRKNQDYTYGDYSIFVAEVASTVNESLLLNYLLDTEKDEKARNFIINRFIEEFRATVFRQTMFAEFELKTHEYVEAGGTLTNDWLSSTYEELNTLYFGDALSKDDYIKYEWSRIPHFYRAYYVYQYATGFSAATSISKRILTEGDTAVKDYKKFLSMGSSDYPVNELKVAGVDMSKKQPIIDAMEMFSELIYELENSLLKK